jgi:NADH-quinone oxidoreductase subunit A
MVLGCILLFVAVGCAFLFVNMMVGKLVRPAKPDAEKMTIYECGEPTVGSSWVQFDLRFYVVALLFVIFDVEVAFFFPWAVVFGKLNALGNPTISSEERAQVVRELDPNPGAADRVQATEQYGRQHATTANGMAWIAFIDILIFFGFLLVGFAYLWRRGDLDWVRSTAAERAAMQTAPRPPPANAKETLVSTY